MQYSGLKFFPCPSSFTRRYTNFTSKNKEEFSVIVPVVWGRFVVLQMSWKFFPCIRFLRDSYKKPLFSCKSIFSVDIKIFQEAFFFFPPKELCNLLGTVKALDHLSNVFGKNNELVENYICDIELRGQCCNRL